MKAIKLSGEALHKAFVAVLNQSGVPEPVREYRFAPPRRWRFDYAYPLFHVAIEIEGGVWTRGRHTRPAGFLKDMEKYNHAALDEWCVLRFTPDSLLSPESIRMIRKAVSTASLGAA